MTSEKIVEVATLYFALLYPEHQPVRFTEEIFHSVCEYSPDKKAEYLRHCCFIALEIPKFIELGTPSKKEKANRWLGWLQCALAFTGTRSMAQCALDNAPESSVYNRDE